MAQLALALGGAVAGKAIFGTALASQIGFLSGSFIGSALFAKNSTIVGPRLNDLSVTSSSYGNPIPVSYGSPRKAGNLIWSTGLEETKTKNKVGGKGGPSTTTISYAYKSSFAIAFDRRESSYVEKIWADSKLIYDMSADEGSALAKKDSLVFRFYTGTKTQMPDPLIESVKGVGNTPAYRGLSYLVFEDFPLADYGNRIPSISAKISYLGTETYPKTYTSWETTSGLIVKDPLRPFIYSIGGNKVSKIDSITGDVVKTADLPPQARVALTDGFAVDENGDFYLQLGSGIYNFCPIYKFNGNSLEIVAGIGSEWHYDAPRRIFNFTNLVAVTLKTGEKIIVAGHDLGTDTHIFSQNEYFDFSNVGTYDQRLKNTLGVRELQYHGHFEGRMDGGIVQDKDGYLWGGGHNHWASVSELRRVEILSLGYDTISPSGALGHTNPTVAIKYWNMASYLSYVMGLIYIKDDHSLLIIGPGKVVKFDIYTETVTAELTNSGITIYGYLGFGDSSIKVLPQSNLVFIGSVVINSSTLELVSSYNFPAHYGIWAARGSNFYDYKTNSYYQSNGGSLIRCWLDRKTGETETLSSVVTDICERCGLTSADIDVTDLATDNVRGYTLTSQTTGKQALEPLAKAYSFEIIETDWKLVFKKKGDAESFSIGSSHLLDKIEETYTQEMDIPESVYLAYYDKDNEQQIGEQFSKRRADVNSSNRKMEMSFPLVLTAGEAKEISSRELYSLWNTYSNFQVKTGLRWIALDPGDVGRITNDLISYGVKIESISFDDMILTINVVEDDSATYTLADWEADGGRGVPDQQIVFDGPSELFLFDTNLLRDIDEPNDSTVPFYMACSSYQETWPGSVVFRSDDGILFSELESFLQSITWGVLDQNLTAVDGWETWDRYRSIQISVINGSLESVTELQALSGSNALLIGNFTDGWEIINFVDATEVSDGVWSVSNLLRGRNGTNNNMQHFKGDYVFLLSPDTLQKIVVSRSDVGVTKYFKAVTIGADIVDTRTLDFNLSANALKPYSPCYPIGERDGSSNLTVTFLRRTRYNGYWKDGTGTVILGEESELYDVDILDDLGEVIRTFSDLSSPEFEYTAAEQTTDGLTPGDLISCVIYQKSSEVGRGYPLEVTL